MSSEAIAETSAQSQADLIVNTRFGGAKPLSDATGLPYRRVHAWIESGRIPHQYWPQLLEVAARLGVPHTPWDYIAHLVAVRPADATLNEAE